VPYGFAAAAAGSVLSGVIGANASGKAASQQAFEQQQALDLQKSVYGDTKNAIAPYTAYGENALQNLQQLLGIGPGGAGPVASNPILKMLGIGGPGPMGSIDPSTFQGSPGYQYAKQQGLEAATNQLSRGPGGGNALMALQKTGQGLADQNWNNYLSNASGAWQQLLQNLGAGVSTGASATSLLTGRGTDFANAAGNNLGNIGNANAQGTMNSAGAWGGALNNLVTNFNNAGGGQAVGSGINSLFSGSGPFSANTLNTTFGTQFGPGTFPTADNPNAIVPGYAADNYTPL